MDNLLSPIEKAFVVRIGRFENKGGGSAALTQKDLVGTWREFTGGADQAGTIIVLKANGEFRYTYNEWFIQRTTTLTGTWKYVDARIVLDVADQDLSLGGYYVQQPDNVVIEGAVQAKIVYDHSLIIRLPVENSTGIPGYKEGAGLTWKRIGTTIFAAD